jgi:hypothetical protein
VARSADATPAANAAGLRDAAPRSRPTAPRTQEDRRRHGGRHRPLDRRASAAGSCAMDDPRRFDASGPGARTRRAARPNPGKSDAEARTRRAAVSRQVGRGRGGMDTAARPRHRASACTIRNVRGSAFRDTSCKLERSRNSRATRWYLLSRAGTATGASAGAKSSPFTSTL